MNMTTNDIIESLKMESIWRSNQPLPSSLLSAIEEGLRERDELERSNENLTIAINDIEKEFQCARDERDALRVENLKLLKIVNRKNTEMAE